MIAITAYNNYQSNENLFSR